MDNNILKIDLDAPDELSAKQIIFERLAYLEDSGAFSVKHIDKIELNHKTNFGAKIYLNINIKEELIIMLQLVLGSDWRKEVHTMINHYMLDMDYSNRLFDVKVYPDGKILRAENVDVTLDILGSIRDKNRKKNYF